MITYFLLHRSYVLRLGGGQDFLSIHEVNTYAIVNLQTDVNFNFSYPSLDDNPERKSAALVQNDDDLNLADGWDKNVSGDDIVLVGAVPHNGLIIHIVNAQLSTSALQYLHEDTLLADTKETKNLNIDDTSREMWFSQQFSDHEAFKKHLKRNAMYNKHLKTNMGKVTARCSNLNCQWHINASAIDNGPYFKVKAVVT